MVKTLFCGDIEGHVVDVIEKVEKLNRSKLGPFDALFCVGKFLNDENNVDIDASTGFPIPTFVVVKDDEISSMLKEVLEKVTNLTLITNVEYISFKELRILCIPGIYDPIRYSDDTNTCSSYYRKSQIESVITSNQSSVDFVLSGEWAYGMSHLLDSSRHPTIPNFATVGSPIISEILHRISPRYQFAGSMNTFYERLPYRNANGSITRIICLGPVRASGDKSRKWLHALNLQPCITMSTEELTQCDSLCTSCPFDVLKRSPSSTEPDAKRQHIGLNDDMIAKLERDSQIPSQSSNYRYTMPVDQPKSNACWFCLAAPTVEKHLIVNVADYAYLACPKGPLTENHVLIIPIVHRQNTVQLPEEAITDINRYKSSLVKMFGMQNKAVIMWERNLTTRNPVHCHIQVIPIDPAKESIVKIVMDAAGTQRGFHFTDIPADQSLSDFAGNDDFLYVEVWGVNAEIPKRFGYVVRDRRPNMQFFHQAVGSLLESANAGEDWKSLQKSTDEEAAVTDTVRELFKPFDFSSVQKEE